MQIIVLNSIIFSKSTIMINTYLKGSLYDKYQFQLCSSRTANLLSSDKEKNRTQYYIIKLDDSRVSLGSETRFRNYYTNVFIYIQIDKKLVVWCEL
jgi:hypothetical protein